MDQVGANVVITGNGSFDTMGLSVTSPLGPPGPSAFMRPNGNVLFLGGNTTNNAFTGLTPSNATFGPGFMHSASSASGAVLGIAFAHAEGNSLYLPNWYVSGTSVSDITTYLGATFASLGVIPGTYNWTWGTGANADRFTLEIGVPVGVPEPASLALLAVGLAGLGIALRLRRA
jgi:hypothetical protein